MVAHAGRERDFQRQLLHAVPLLVAASHNGGHLHERRQSQHPSLFRMDNEGGCGRSVSWKSRVGRLPEFFTFIPLFSIRGSVRRKPRPTSATMCLR